MRSCNSLGEKKDSLLYDKYIHRDSDIGTFCSDNTVMYGTRSSVLCKFSVRVPLLTSPMLYSLKIFLFSFLPMKNERKSKLKPKSSANLPSIYQLLLKMLISTLGIKTLVLIKI